MDVNDQAWKSNEHNRVGQKNDPSLPARFPHELENTHSRFGVKDTGQLVGCAYLLRGTFVDKITVTRFTLLFEKKLAPRSAMLELGDNC